MIVARAGVQRDSGARRDLVAEDQTEEEVATADPPAGVSDGEKRRQHGDAGMPLREGVPVMSIEGVDGRGTGVSRAGRARRPSIEQDARATLACSHLADGEIPGHARQVGLRSARRDADQVQEASLRLLDDLVRHGLERELMDEADRCSWRCSAHKGGPSCRSRSSSLRIRSGAALRTVGRRRSRQTDVAIVDLGGDQARSRAGARQFATDGVENARAAPELHGAAASAMIGHDDRQAVGESGVAQVDIPPRPDCRNRRRPHRRTTRLARGGGSLLREPRAMAGPGSRYRRRQGPPPSKDAGGKTRRSGAPARSACLPPAARKWRG